VMDMLHEILTLVSLNETVLHLIQCSVTKMPRLDRMSNFEGFRYELCVLRNWNMIFPL
jgi:hypothetical protein